MRVIGLEIDIANNIKTVELLKVELLQKVTDLFGDISAETDCETLQISPRILHAF